MRVNQLSEYSHWVGVGYVVCYLFYFILSKSIHFNQNAYLKVYKFEKYICFIILDISQKYSYPKLGMFLNLGRFC